jgi:sulfur-oxidizing protein SoxA
MSTLQGIPEADIVKGSFGRGVRKDLEAVVAYVVTQSKDMKVNVPAAHPKEKEMLALGEKIFYLQGGPMDFSCASCHAVDDKRIRMQDLPNLTKSKGAAEGWGSWPAYRVSSGTFWTMQRRLNDCYRQQRMPFPIYGSDVTIALSIFMANKADGGIIQTPGLKR